MNTVQCPHCEQTIGEDELKCPFCNGPLNEGPEAEEPEEEEDE